MPLGKAFALYRPERSPCRRLCGESLLPCRVLACASMLWAGSELLCFDSGGHPASPRALSPRRRRGWAGPVLLGSES